MKNGAGALLFVADSGCDRIGLVGGTAFALAWQGQYSGKVFPGVAALRAFMTWVAKRRQAKKLLRDKVAAFSASPVVLAWNGKEWKPSLDDLGVQLSVNETVRCL